MLLCGEHHRSLHDGAFAVEAAGRQRFRFRDDAGTAIDYAPSVRGQAGDLSAYTLVDGDTLTPDWYGDPLTRDGLGVIVDTYVRNRATDERPGDPWMLAA